MHVNKPGGPGLIWPPSPRKRHAGFGKCAAPATANPDSPDARAVASGNRCCRSPAPWPACDDRPRLLFAERRRNLGLVQIVTARAAATQMRVRQFHQFHAANRAQQQPRFAAHALRVGQMTRVVITQSAALPLSGNGSRKPSFCRNTLTSGRACGIVPSWPHPPCRAGRDDIRASPNRSPPRW